MKVICGMLGGEKVDYVGGGGERIEEEMNGFVEWLN